MHGEPLSGNPPGLICALRAVQSVRRGVEAEGVGHDSGSWPSDSRTSPLSPQTPWVRLFLDDDAAAYDAALGIEAPASGHLTSV